MKEQERLSRSVNKAAAGDLLGLKASTLADPRWRKRVGLRAFRVGGALRFREQDVLAMIAAGLERFADAERKET